MSVTLINPSPRTSSGDVVSAADGDSVVCCNGPQDLARRSSSANLSDFIDGEPPSGAGCCKVPHVLSVVPEVQVAQIDTAKVPVVAGVENVGVSGVAIMDDPHSSCCGDVSPIDRHGAASVSPKGCLAFVCDDQRGFAEDSNQSAASDSANGSGFTGFLHPVGMHLAVAACAVLAVASFNLTKFHSRNSITHLGV